MKFRPYPITVEPILKEKVWGGKNLSAFVDINNKKIGEVWMLADQNENMSVISNGILKGTTLGAAIAKFPLQIMGPRLIKKYGKKFPLLFKYLDTNDRISVQVHPDDAYAKKRGFYAGKTEMWYVLASKLKSSLLLGFKHSQTKKTVAEAAHRGHLVEKMKKYTSKKGDCFFVPAGTVHTIGKGNVIFEIQQNSDITYRIYDWGRQNLREDRHLNVNDALGSIKFTSNSGKCQSDPFKFSDSITARNLTDCGYFRSDEFYFEKETSYWYNQSKVIVAAVIEGEIDIFSGNEEVKRYDKGKILLVPYSLNNFMIKAKRNTRLIITEVK
jgi:mannose-6-phosphate isomerase